MKPLNWKKSACELDKVDPDNNGFKNTDFMIWMRTAALPDFRKPYRRLVNKDEFSDGLPVGDYILEIDNSKFLEFLFRNCFVISLLLKGVFFKGFWFIHGQGEVSKNRKENKKLSRGTLC